MTVRNSNRLIQTDIGPQLIAASYSDGSWVGNLDPDLEQAKGTPEQPDIYIPAKLETQVFQEAALRPEPEDRSHSEFSPSQLNLCGSDTNSFIRRSAQLWAPLREAPADHLELRDMDALYLLGKREAGRILGQFQECLSNPERLRSLPKDNQGRLSFVYQPYLKSPEAKYRGWIEVDPSTSPARLNRLVLEHDFGNRVVIQDLEHLDAIPGVENSPAFRESLLRLWQRG